jgi:outer membrane receptor protein involved in Fe transport
MDWDVLPGLTNNFIYDENIYALYGILGNKVDRYSWQVGLRAEYSDIRTELVQNDSVNDRTYANLFPSVFLGYEMSDKNAFQVSYSRRIRRPDFRDLNPFFSYSDARNFRSGNPNLDPEFTDSYEIGFLRYFENGSVTTSMFFRHTDQVIENIREQLSDVSALSYPVNLSTRNDYGLEVTGAYDLLKRWRVSGNANFFRSQTDGTYKNQVFRADTYTWFGRLSSRVTLWRKLDVQVNVNYRAPRNTTQGRSKAFWHVDPAASIDLFQGNATLTFSVRDLFNTRRWRYITEGYNFYTEGDFQWRARQSTLTFSYRLNQQPQKGRDGKRGGGFEGDGGDF